MQNKSVLKKLLAVSAVAAMFSAWGVHAQTNSAQTTTSTTSQGTQNMSGKTTRDGTVDNTNSWGKENRGNASTQSGATGSSTGSAQTGSGDTTGTAGGANMSGKTTQGGTMGNTNSQGMESRTQGRDQATGSSSGSAGMSGSTGTSGTGAAAAQSGSGATASGSGTLSKGDQKILMDMARANIAEIEAGKLAQSKSQNDQVKSYAQQMIDDHSKALTELQQLAQAKGVTLPTEPDAKHKAMAAKLEKMNGEAFDKAYMAQAGLQDHKRMHSKLMSDQKRAKDPDVKAAATKMAPVVEQHLKSAQQMPAVKSGTTSGK